MLKAIGWTFAAVLFAATPPGANHSGDDAGVPNDDAACAADYRSGAQDIETRPLAHAVRKTLPEIRLAIISPKRRGFSVRW
jgi:hypothetical protein